MTEDARQTTTPNPQPLRVLALCGFMGSGKSTVGRTLAELMGWEFVDLDEEIERQEGTSIREIFVERGEAEFREIEHRVLTKLAGFRPNAHGVCAGWRHVMRSRATKRC